jgi:hypothetical protein
MTARERDADRFIDLLCDVVRAMIRQDQIGGHVTLSAALENLRESYKLSLGMKPKEGAEP